MRWDVSVAGGGLTRCVTAQSSSVGMLTYFSLPENLFLAVCPLQSQEPFFFLEDCLISSPHRFSEAVRWPNGHSQEQSLESLRGARWGSNCCSTITDIHQLAYFVLVCVFLKFKICLKGRPMHTHTLTYVPWLPRQLPATSGAGPGPQQQPGVAPGSLLWVHGCPGLVVTLASQGTQPQARSRSSPECHVPAPTACFVPST